MLQSIRVGRPYVRPGDVGAIRGGWTIYPAGKELPHLIIRSGNVGLPNCPIARLPDC
jgi:hypothetical protein